MATRGERARYAAERSGPPRAKAAVKKPRRYVDTSKPGVAADDRKAGGPDTARRNLRSRNTFRYDLESSTAPKRPSRKSSRGGSKSRQKLGNQLQAKHEMRLVSPQERRTQGIRAASSGRKS